MNLVAQLQRPRERDPARPPRKVGSRAVLFGLVGLSGIAVNTAALALLSHALGLHYVAGVVLATVASTSWNFGLNEAFVFRLGGARPGQRRLRRFAAFAALNYAAFAIRGPVLVALVEGAHVHVLLANIAALLVAFVARFAVADRLIWRKTAALAPAARTALTVAAHPVPLELPPEPFWSLPKRVAVLASVAAPALLVRFWALGAVGFNSDEAVYAGQGASLSGLEATLPYFPVFRAHPLLFQALVSLPYELGGEHVIGRVLSALFGVATVGAVFLLGRELYGRRVGAAAALLLAVMPYHAVVTRQVLLDGPMTFFTTVHLWLLARFGRTNRPVWLWAASATLGLSFLTKETSIVLAGGGYLFIAITPSVRARLRSLAAAGAIGFAVMLPFPLAVRLAGKSSTGEAFLTWQLFRRQNHPWEFYAAYVTPALGALVVCAALAGIALLWRDRSWRESLLLCWMAVPIAFFQIWPVKGFQYLLPIAAPMAVLAARAIVFGFWQQKLRRAALALMAITLLVPTWTAVNPASTTEFLAGSGGVPGGREAGEWVAANVPVGARLLAIGPSMANIVQFYGQRKAYGLSVSNNPLHRNPVYEPVPNPDLWLRQGEVQYLVWDSYSAARTKFFSERLLRLAERYNGRVVHTQTLKFGGAAKPVIVIYQVRP